STTLHAFGKYPSRGVLAVFSRILKRLPALSPNRPLSTCVRGVPFARRCRSIAKSADPSFSSDSHLPPLRRTYSFVLLGVRLPRSPSASVAVSGVRPSVSLAAVSPYPSSSVAALPAPSVAALPAPSVAALPAPSVAVRLGRRYGRMTGRLARVPSPRLPSFQPPSPDFFVPLDDLGIRRTPASLAVRVRPPRSPPVPLPRSPFRAYDQTPRSHAVSSSSSASLAAVLPDPSSSSSSSSSPVLLLVRLLRRPSRFPVLLIGRPLCRPSSSSPASHATVPPDLVDRLPSWSSVPLAVSDVRRTAYQPFVSLARHAIPPDPLKHPPSVPLSPAVSRALCSLLPLARLPSSVRVPYYILCLP
ncbi:hypothetical protein K488DRAFT_92800, partial [Vararia minispora EC-137]